MNRSHQSLRLNTLGVAELRSEKPAEAIQHFQRAIAFYEALGQIRFFAAFGGETFSTDERYFNHVCIVLCRIDLKENEAAITLLNSLPAPVNASGDYAAFYAEAKSQLDATE